jgi:hypothetical protein
MSKFIFLLVIIILKSSIIFSQVAINTDGSLPAPSAMLDVKATDRGLLIPRISTEQRDRIPSPATGLMIYNTSTNQINYYNGNYWFQVESSFISSKIIEGKLGMHPLTTIIVVLIGGEFFGIPGMLIAVPVAAILKIIIKRAVESIV